MANTKISNLTEATSVDADDLKVIVQGGVTKKVKNSAPLKGAKFGGTVDYSEFEDDGTLVHHGEAVVWDDYEFPINNLRVNPNTNRPGFDFDAVEFQFDASTTETVVGNGHMPHSWKIGTDIKPHIHWKQTQDNKPAWRLEYKLWGNNVAEPASWNTLNTTTEAFPYPGSEITQISSFGAIDTTGVTGVSANIKVKVSRVGANDTYTGDASFYKFDIHFQKDTEGSRQEYIK